VGFWEADYRGTEGPDVGAVPAPEATPDFGGTGREALDPCMIVPSLSTVICFSLVFSFIQWINIILLFPKSPTLTTGEALSTFDSNILFGLISIQLVRIPDPGLCR
jgi:hypothetical protein